MKVGRPSLNLTPKQRRLRWLAMQPPEKLKAYQSNYREKERSKAVAAAYRAAHREEARAARKEWAAKNPIRARAAAANWKKNNLEKVRAKNHRRVARSKSASGWGYTTAAHISARWSMFGDRCWMCGDPATATDHVKPLNKGGSHWPSNLRPICGPCNSSKKDVWPINLRSTFSLGVSFVFGFFFLLFCFWSSPGL